MFVGCTVIKPKDFTYLFDNEYTGIDTLIRTNGYYAVQRGCDSSLHTLFMFYTNGLFVNATDTNARTLKICFESNADLRTCRYLLWGTYRITGDTIHTQTIKQEGIGICTIFRDYRIVSDKSLINIADYVIPENTKLGSMKKYPSFHENSCEKESAFYPLESKRDSTTCPLLKKKYFRK